MGSGLGKGCCSTDPIVQGFPGDIALPGELAGGEAAAMVLLDQIEAFDCQTSIRMACAAN